MEKFTTIFIPYIVPSLNLILDMRTQRNGFNKRVIYKEHIKSLVDTIIQEKKLVKITAPVCISYFPLTGSKGQEFDKGKQKKRGYDVDNYAGCIKFITDAFKDLGMYENDDPRYIKANYTNKHTEVKHPISGILMIIEVDDEMDLVKHKEIAKEWIKNYDL